MRLRHTMPLAAVLACTAALSSAARAQDSCLALSRAEAATALGVAPEDVSINTSYQGAKKYTCTFAAAATRLTVAVAPYRFQDGWASYTAQCAGKDKAVPGVGNEAVECDGDGSVEVLSHVTDTFFKLALSGTGKPPEMSDAARKAARVVAGNLR